MLPIVAKRLITITVVSGLVVTGASTTAMAQLARVADNSWAVSRTADGQPDLQGIWGNKTLTPMERRDNDEGKSFLSDEEIARINQQRVVDEQARDDAPAQRYEAGGNVGGYASYWLDSGEQGDERLGRVEGGFRDHEGGERLSLIHI